MHARIFIALVALAVAAGLAACGSDEAGDRASSRAPKTEDGWTAYAPLDADDADSSGEIEVPDATYGDGDDAWTAVEDEGLTPVFLDANDDPSFDDTRDGTGCDVLDQAPVAGEFVAEGDEVEITIDCAQLDWEDQEGTAWELFNEAYTIAFDDGCQALFDDSPDGSFYEDDYEYTVDDCQSFNPGDAMSLSDVPDDVPDDPSPPPPSSARLTAAKPCSSRRACGRSTGVKTRSPSTIARSAATTRPPSPPRRTATGQARRRRLRRRQAERHADQHRGR